MVKLVNLNKEFGRHRNGEIREFRFFDANQKSDPRLGPFTSAPCAQGRNGLSHQFNTDDGTYSPVTVQRPCFSNSRLSLQTFLSRPLYPINESHSEPVRDQRFS